MFKPKVEDLERPVKVRDFIEFTEDIGNVLADIIQKEVGEAKDTILASNDKLMLELKTIREEQSMKIGRDDRQDEEINETKEKVKAVEQRVGIAYISP